LNALLCPQTERMSEIQGVSEQFLTQSRTIQSQRGVTGSLH
jgi:hypothetical protein